MQKSSITANITLTPLSMMDSSWENFENSSYTYFSFPNASKKHANISEDMSMSFEEKIMFGIFITVLFIFFIGAVGNGAVIWLLGFRIKRNSFSTFILNLAVADFGVLISVIASIFFIFDFANLGIDFTPPLGLFLLMYTASQFLLTAISIDRCVAVFLPLWHRCKRPPHLSTTVCALIWVLSILLTGITYTRLFVNVSEPGIEKFYQFIVNVALCLPVMTIATVALSRKFLKAGQQQRGRLLTIVLLTLLFFLLFALPFNVIFIASLFDYTADYIALGAFLLAILNSIVNPIIYFLVGRQRKTRPKESMKMILQNVFKEDEGRGEETPV